ncbi:MAG: hypothetical protein J5486_07395 [Bacteroidaceae bacterium]|nr:hypothetical protein [Bacteroidaceae bacterium]
MRFNTNIVIALVMACAIACGVVGCAASKSQQHAKVQSYPADLSTTMRFNNVMMEASVQRILGNTSAYYDLLDYALSLSPDAPEALYQMGFMRTLLEQRGMTTDTVGLDMLKSAAQLDPRNTTYLQTLVNLYIQQDSMELALAAQEQLAAQQPRSTSVLSTLVDLYEYADRHQEAIEVLDRMEVISGKSLSVSYRKFRNYSAMDKKTEAYAEIESLCKEFPYDPSYRLILGDLLMQDERYDDAYQEYLQVQRADSTAQGLQVSLLNYYKATGADSLYQSLRDDIIFSTKTESSIRSSVMMQYIDDVRGLAESDSLVTSMFDRLEARLPNDIDLLRIESSYFVTQSRKNQTMNPRLFVVLERIIDIEPDKELLFALIQHYGEQQQYDRLEDICRKGVIHFPDELVCHFYLGIACYQQEHKADALKAFQDGVTHRNADSNPNIVAELFGVMGDLLHDLGYPNSQTYAAYDSSLVYKPDNASYLNNYAYYLSLDNTKLDQAEEMSYRSLRLEPNNKTYLDTYAWILFTKERYVEAQAYIDRVCPPSESDSALCSDPRVSGVVLEHAGDIAALNDNIEQALRFWQLAQSVGGDGLTAALPRKIRLKKYIK